ncbi:ABC transporter substrate-binding protein [Paenibacillaceae bacterium WGS1546]|uniref:ABC transporter substrate-binding protein n=1 Tax=Cohnella sp. WGS1546 TaxID=3366810 RepID=UPI00372D1B5E
MAKKLLFGCLAATMVFTAACSQGGNGGSSPSPSAPSGTATESASPSEQPLDKVTFTFFNGVANAPDLNMNETTIGKILEDQTGVNFYMEHVVGDLNTKIGTMIASREFPDVMAPDDAMSQVLGAGAFIDLTDLIEEHGPNIKRVYEPYFNQMRSEDGKIYTLPFSTVVNEYQPDPNINQGAFWLQRRVLKEAGYPKIKTMDEYFQLIEDFVAKHPDEDLIGFTALTHDWRFFALANQPMHLAGYPNDGNVLVDMETYEAKTYATNDDTKRWLEKLNEFNAKGLFDKSSFVDNYDQYLAKLSSKKVVGFFDYGWQTGNARNLLRDAARQDPSQDDFVYFPMPITFDGQKDQLIDPPGFVKDRGVGITVSAKDPVRIIQYFDNLLKEENQILKSWGIEGETYEVDENGRFYRTQEQVNMINEDFNLKFGFRYYAWDWPQYGTNSTLADGNAFAAGLQPEVFQMGLTAEDKHILEQYGVQTYAELFAKPDERPWFPAWGIPKEQGSPQQIWETRKDEVTLKYFPRLILAKPEEFEGIWAEYLQEFGKLDTAGYEQWYTEQIKKIIDEVNQ